MSSLPIHLLNQNIVGGNSGVSGSMSANITSLPINLDEAKVYSIQAVMTGSPVGTITLQGSDDIVTSSASSPVNWTTIPDSSASISAAGTYMVSYSDPGYSWVQLLYTFTSGTGTMTARINVKR